MPLTPTTIKHGRLDVQSINSHDIYSQDRLRSSKFKGKNQQNKKLILNQFKN